jgi:hypothetical protein
MKISGDVYFELETKCEPYSTRKHWSSDPNLFYFIKEYFTSCNVPCDVTVYASTSAFHLK